MSHHTPTQRTRVEPVRTAPATTALLSPEPPASTVEPDGDGVQLSDGVRLHVEQVGPATAPITVLLLHGWTLDRRTWHRQVSALAGTLGDSVRIISYDARGHGRSGVQPAGRRHPGPARRRPGRTARPGGADRPGGAGRVTRWAA